MLLHLAIIFINDLIVITEQARLSIINESRFPHPLATLFKLQVVPFNRKDKLDQFTANTLVLRITDNKGKERAKHTFEYGQKYEIGEIIKNDLITIEEWTKNRDSTVIQLSISFNRISNGHSIQILDLSASSSKIRKIKINNLGSTKPIYNETIQLVSPSKLQLTVNDISGDYVVLGNNQLNVAKCRSYDGIPLETANFTNLQNFDVVNRTFVNENTEIEIMFRVRVSDHMKPLNCRTKLTNTAMVIRVLHPTTEIIIEPPINKTLEVNSSISCYPSEGYPPSKIQWHFINGPTNATSFYELKNKDKDLHIKSDAPTETFWRFSCSVTGERSINKTISFITTDKYCDIFCLNGKINRQNFQLLMINDEINKSVEILKETSRNYWKILQESIANIKKKYDSIGQRNKQEIDEIKSNLRYGIIDVPALEWTIYRVSDKVTRQAHLYKEFFPGEKIYKFDFNVYFYPDKLRMYLISYPFNSFQSNYPIKVETTIAVINPANPQYKIIVHKSFVLDKEFASSPHFIVTKDELVNVFLNDFITIKCFNKFIN